MGCLVIGFYFYDYPGTNNFILGFVILVMGDLIGSSGGYGDGGDDAESGGGGSIVVGGGGGRYGDGGGDEYGVCGGDAEGVGGRGGR